MEKVRAAARQSGAVQLFSRSEIRLWGTWTEEANAADVAAAPAANNSCSRRRRPEEGKEEEREGGERAGPVVEPRTAGPSLGDPGSPGAPLCHDRRREGAGSHLRPLLLTEPRTPGGFQWKLSPGSVVRLGDGGGGGGSSKEPLWPVR